MTDNDDELPEQNEEDVEGQRKMDFILDQLAQFASDTEHMKEAAVRITSVIERLTSALSTLADAQIRTEKNFAALAENMTKLAESQAHTDRRLDALIDFIQEDRDDEKIN
ncbi:MAG TPA: hypothetical protein VJT74_01460 [Pyrinomonadaceae bacterium]|nr:hypothetical protein [Pyrinomonadaceae bacterium]